MLAKFLLIIYIGKYLSIKELGEYGILVTTIALLVYFIGFEFYNYNTREILNTHQENHYNLIYNQFIFHLIIYMFFLPLIYVFLFINLIPIKYTIFFYLILIFEHLSQELYRLYITFSKIIFANVILFIRSALWVYILLLLWIFDFSVSKNLESILYFWLSGAFISFVVGVIFIKKIISIPRLYSSINKNWILKGLRSSVPFFIAAISYKIIEFSDRYIIDFYLGKEDVGIYVFFSSIVNLIPAFVFTIVYSVYYPLLSELVLKKEDIKFQNLIFSFTRKTLVYTIFFTIILILIMPYMLQYLNKVEFTENLNIFWILIIGIFMQNISMIYHYILYATHSDKSIQNSVIIGALINVVLNFVLIPSYGLIGAAIATTFSQIYILIHKQIIVRSKNIKLIRSSE